MSPSHPSVWVYSLLTQPWLHPLPALPDKKKNIMKSKHLWLHAYFWYRSMCLQSQRTNLLEQCSLTGGRQSSLAISVFLIFRASSICTQNREHYNVGGNVRETNLEQDEIISLWICAMAWITMTHRFPLHPLCGQRAGSNGRATAKRFESGIYYFSILIHLNLSNTLTKHIRVIIYFYIGVIILFIYK